MLIGIGSAVFHPESSRVARIASGGRFGTAQSLFQLGGNFGTALGPLLAAFIVVPLGRPSVALFSAAAMLGSFILWRVGNWAEGRRRAGGPRAETALKLSRQRVIWAIVVLALLTFTKNIYTASISSYYTFFLIEKFALTTQQAQLMLFLFLGGMAGGVMGGLGGFTGVLPTLWCTLRGLDKDVQRAIIQNFNLAMLLVTFVTYLATGLVTREALPLLAIVVPAMLVPVLLGARLYHGISDARFRQIVLGLLTLSGGAMLVASLPRVLGSWG